MRVLNKDEVAIEEFIIVKKLKESVFVYPTDTIYGIGCDATNSENVKRIRQIKERFDMPFSIIAPSKEWIEAACEVDEKARDWIARLPGPYTLILALKNKESVSKNVNIGYKTIGVRIPDNWFSKIVTQMNTPIVTTSANLSGEDFMTSFEDLNPEIKNKVDYVVDDGELRGRPSTLVYLDEEKEKLQER